MPKNIDPNKQSIIHDVTSSADGIEIFPFENATEEQKKEIIEGFIKLSGKHAIQIFKSLGLKTHMESMLIDQDTNEEYIFSFKKVT